MGSCSTARWEFPREPSESCGTHILQFCPGLHFCDCPFIDAVSSFVVKNAVPHLFFLVKHPWRETLPTPSGLHCLLPSASSSCSPIPAPPPSLHKAGLLSLLSRRLRVRTYCPVLFYAHALAFCLIHFKWSLGLRNNFTNSIWAPCLRNGGY